MKVLGLIPARGGSKGIVRKNVRLLAGQPLLAYTAQAALRARRLSRVILSTEDDEIAAYGRKCGLEVPFLRPAELARDETPTLPVVQHAVEWLEKQHCVFDAVCLLQPTNPMRRPEHIDDCVDLLINSGADSVVTVLPVPVEYNPHWVYFRDPAGFLRLSTGEPSPIHRRQELPPSYHREGSVYVTRRDVLMKQGSLYGRRLVGYAMEESECVNLDTEADWDLATKLIAIQQRDLRPDSASWISPTLSV